MFIARYELSTQTNQIYTGLIYKCQKTISGRDKLFDMYCFNLKRKQEELSQSDIMASSLLLALY